LPSHPAVRQASVIGAPRLRLGEIVCAFVACRSGMTVDLPEQLRLVDDMPMTAFGKVRKNVRKDKMAAMAAA